MMATTAEALLYTGPLDLDIAKRFMQRADIGLIRSDDLRAAAIPLAGDAARFSLVYDDSHVGVLVREADQTLTWFDPMHSSPLSRAVLSKIKSTEEHLLGENLQLLAQSSCLAISVVYCNLRRRDPFRDHSRTVREIASLSPFRIRNMALELLF